MKKILKIALISLIALKSTSLIIDTLSFGQSFKTLFIASLAWTAFEYLVKPVAKILFLPINLITMGALRWVINVIGLYLVTILIDGVNLTSYGFPGLEWQGLVIPSINFSIITTYILTAFVINLNISLISWILK